MKKIFIISLLLCLFLVSSVFSQEIMQDGVQEGIVTTQEEIASVSNFVKQDDLIKFQKNSIWQLAIINLSYLMICVMIVLALAGIQYLFNVRPLQEKIDKTEKDLRGKISQSIDKHEERIETLEKDTKKEITLMKERSLGDINYLRGLVEERNKILRGEMKGTFYLEFEKLKQKTEKIELNLIDKLSILEKKHQVLEIMTSWIEHYTWETNGVYINVLTTLTFGLGLVIKYKEIGWYPIFIKEINRILEKLHEMKKTIGETDYNELIHELEKVEGFVKEKGELIKKAKDLLKNSGK